MKIAILVSFSGVGGVERGIVNLVNCFVQDDNLEVDLILIRADTIHLFNFDDKVNIIKLSSNHSLTSIPELIDYINRERPFSILVAKERAARAAIIANLLSKFKTRIIVQLNTNLSASLREKPFISKFFRIFPMKLLYAHVDKIVAVSEGVKLDTLKLTNLGEDEVVVIKNPVLTASMFSLAKKELEHPWINNENIFVVMGIGRLSRQKDFHTLIKAFYELKREMEVKLIILGEGRDKNVLEKLVERLDLESDVYFAGFDPNPYRWLSRADLFVLSSRWEGSGNVLTEALALGVPAVATDCESGPAEILDNGKYGMLVNVGDYINLSEAMFQTLKDPHQDNKLKEAVIDYSDRKSANSYLKLMLSNNKYEI